MESSQIAFPHCVGGREGGCYHRALINLALNEGVEAIGKLFHLVPRSSHFTLVGGESQQRKRSYRG